MITVETIGRVRHAFHIKGRKIKEIAREFRLMASLTDTALILRQSFAFWLFWPDGILRITMWRNMLRVGLRKPQIEITAP